MSKPKAKSRPSREAGRHVGAAPRPHEPGGPAGGRFDPKAWTLGALLVLLTFVAFRPAASAGYIWDDNDYVTENPNVADPGGLANIWLRPDTSPQYYPLVFTTYWIEYRLWGLDPRGYHEVNILLHAASAVLLWLILKRLNIPGAYLAAAVFAVHPVMVESVAWVTERKNTLSLLFYLLAGMAYLRYAGIGEGGRKDEGGEGSVGAGEQRPEVAGTSPNALYFVALGLFVCALLSKTVTSTLPAALLLVIWWKRGRIGLRDVVPLLPFLFLGVAAGAMTGYLEREQVGATGAEFDLSAAQRILVAGRAAWFYLAKLVAPVRLTFIYPRWQVDPGAAWQWAFPALLVLAVAGLWAFRRRFGRGPLAAALFFVGTLVPALGFVNVYPFRYSFVADHFQYHASLGAIAGLAAGVTLLLRGLEARRTGGAGYAVPIAGTVIVAVLLVMTAAQSRIYASAESLWTDTIHKNPGSWMAWTNLGHAHMAKVPPDRAAAATAYHKAFELAPGVPDTRYNMGNVRLAAGDLDAAEREFRAALDLQPKYPDALERLGYVARERKQWGEAIAHYRKALDLQPAHDRARMGLAIALREDKQYDAAAAELQEMARQHPGYPPIHRELATTFIRQEKFAQAEAPLRALVELDPRNADALFDLAIVLIKLDRKNEAAGPLNRALQLKPQLRARLPRQN